MSTLDLPYESRPAQPVDKAIFDAILRDLPPMPDGVHRVEFRFGEDHAGDPAVWIIVVADDDPKPSKRKLAEIRRLIEAVEERVLRSGTGLFPYSRIVTL